MMDEAKFRNAVLYLLRRSAPARPGLVGLVKMLWLADYEHYRKHLAPITHAEYVALPDGPVVNDYRDVFAAMEHDALIDKTEVKILGAPYPKVEYQPKQEPDAAIFTESEISVLDEIATTYGTWSGKRLIQKTHVEGPWKLVRQGDTIPYALFRWLDNLPDEEVLAEARKQVEGRPDVVKRIEELSAATATA